MTGSLARDGQGGMTDVLPLDPTGVTYTNDPDTGMYRTGANAQAIKCGGSDIVDITTSGIDVTGTITQGGVTLQPAGVIVAYGGSTAPSGWLLCYGQSLLRASYVALFAAIGTTYGAADGTHFSLPDLRGRIAAGKDNMGGSAAGRLTSTTMTPDGVTLGAAGGAQTVTLDATMIPSHTHTASVTDPGHTHDQIVAADTNPNTIRPDAANSSSAQVSVATASATTGITVSNSSTGGGLAHSNVQPTIVTNYIIFAGV